MPSVRRKGPAIVGTMAEGPHLAVVGAGPAGLAAALAAAARGVRVTLVDSAAEAEASSTVSLPRRSARAVRRPCTISGAHGNGCVMASRRT